ncbi:hypothetical protein GCM10012287_09680 [Streptomyces daqingensis]|uniref:Uncharacterized protein n=1 Tax=Streptomyces daqingensis TaxID=1472640 RepID=A0ABQ2LXB0_9ACTN|nr:DUF5819 family protein [Streptomyces daqingensis]GGO44335.1 hypothetical protein GCM10012287_09680 [Streptomyces daqingensis]
MTRRIRNIRRVALLCGVALLGSHFMLAALSQAPLSPAKLRYHGPVNEYLAPYFTQNWLLFAPVPLSDDQGILARARCGSGSVTRYYDVTSQHIERVHGSRFFPSRMSRLVTNSLQQIHNTDEVMERYRVKAQNDKKPLPPLMPHEKASRDEAVDFLSRYASDQHPPACGGRRPHAVQVRMYVHELPPWSRRDQPADSGKVSVEDFPWREVGSL